MSTAYQVKRSELLAVKDIEVVFDGTSSNNDITDDNDELYLKTIIATITGRETSSGTQVTLGQMTADCVGEESWAIYDEHSAGLAMLFRACFTEQAIYQEVLPEEYTTGNILMVETIQLEPHFRGHSIGPLALDRLVRHVVRASPESGNEGLLVMEPSNMSETATTHENGPIQEKLIQYYVLFGLWVLVRMTRSHPTFLGHCVCDYRPDIRTLVPHLLQ